MDDGTFESQDRSLKEDLGRLPRKEVPPKMLQGFSASVERRILERQERRAPRPWAFRLPVLVPTFAVAVLAFVAVTRLPQSGTGPLPSPARTQIASHSAAISEEVAMLRELGVWTEEDESALGIEDADLLEQVELTREIGQRSSAIV